MNLKNTVCKEKFAMKTKEITFVESKVAKLTEVELREMREDDVLIKTEFTTISCGTEKANLIGDPSLCTTAEAAEATYPRTLGYNCSGIVEKVGEKVTSVKPGDKVVGYWSKHRQYDLLPEKQVVKIEHDNVSTQIGGMSFIATFPLAAIRKTNLEIGEPAMVMGLGILGLIAVSLLRAAGASPVVAVDPIPERREKALKFGADYAFDPFDSDFAEKVKAVTGGVKVAIEVTGVGAGLNETLDCMAKYGRVALLGCTRDSHFEIDYYRKVHGPGISLIGAHTAARPLFESSRGYYTHGDDIKTILKLVSLGRLDLKGMVDEIHAPGECEEVYNRLILDKKFPTVVQFDWNK